MVFQKNTIIPGFLITTWSKDQGQLPLKYKHVTSGEHSSYLHISCSTYLSCVQSIFVAQTRVPPPLPWSQSTWPRTELENRNLAAPRIFQAGNIPNREKGGERGQNKSNWQGNRNCPNFVTFTMLSGGKRNPGFCPTCPWFHTKGLSGLLNVGASEAELMHPVGLGSRGWGWKWGVGREEGEPWVPMRSGLPQGRTM